MLSHTVCGSWSVVGRPLIAASGRYIFTSNLSMGHGSHSSDNNPDVIEKEKHRNLTGQTPEIVPGQPGWNPSLASDSEAAVRAERAPDVPIEELQEHTVKVVQHLHHDADQAVPEEVHDPSDSPAIQDNIKKTAEKDAHHPL